MSSDDRCLYPRALDLLALGHLPGAFLVELGDYSQDGVAFAAYYHEIEPLVAYGPLGLLGAVGADALGLGRFRHFPFPVEYQHRFINT